MSAFLWRPRVRAAVQGMFWGIVGALTFIGFVWAVALLTNTPIC